MHNSGPYDECHYDIQLLCSMIYKQSLLKGRTRVNIIHYGDILGSSMTGDYIVKLVLFRYTIRASVTAQLAVGGENGMAIIGC